MVGSTGYLYDRRGIWTHLVWILALLLRGMDSGLITSILGPWFLRVTVCSPHRLLGLSEVELIIALHRGPHGNWGRAAGLNSTNMAAHTWRTTNHAAKRSRLGARQREGRE